MMTTHTSPARSAERLATEIGADSGLAVRTVANALRGVGTPRISTRRAILASARKLGLVDALPERLRSA